MIEREHILTLYEIYNKLLKNNLNVSVIVILL